MPGLGKSCWIYLIFYDPCQIGDLEASEEEMEIKSKDPTKVELTREIRERDVQR